MEQKLTKKEHPFFSQIVPVLFFHSKVPVQEGGEWVAGEEDFVASVPLPRTEYQGVDLSPKWSAADQEGAPSAGDLYDIFKKLVAVRAKAATSSGKTGEARSTADFLLYNRNIVALCLEDWLNKVGSPEIQAMVSEDCPGAIDGANPLADLDRTSTGRVKKARKAPPSVEEATAAQAKKFQMMADAFVQATTARDERKKKESRESKGVDTSLLDATSIWKDIEEEQERIQDAKKKMESATDPEDKKGLRDIIKIRTKIVRQYREEMARLCPNSSDDESQIDEEE